MFYYRYLLDVNRDYSFSGGLTDITGYVTRASWQFGLLASYDTLGNAAYMEIALDNSGGAFSLENSNALYYGKIRRGTMLRVQMSTNGASWTNMASLKIQQIAPSYSMNGAHEVTLKASDIMADFLAQDFVAPLQTNVRIDEILERVHTGAHAIWPYESYYQFIGHTSIGDGRAPFYGADWIDFETAETTLPYYGDNLDRGQGVKAQQYIKDATQAEIFGIYYFSPRDELFHFLSRYHASDTEPLWNITSSIIDAPRFTYARDLKNDYALGYYPRAIGAADSVLYSSDNVPFRLPTGAVKRMTLKYRDPDNESATVGALVVNDIVRGVDITAHLFEDGSGEDFSGRVSITLIKGTSSSEIIIANNRTARRDLYITTLQLRGTPLTAYNKETAYGYNDVSIYGAGADESSGNDRASASDNFYAVSNIDFAQSVADYMVNVFSQPQVAVEKLTIPVNPSDSTTQAQVMARTIGDVINLSISETGHNMDYMIVGESHSANPTTNIHTVTYTLRPSNRAALFVWDESTYGSGDSFSF